MLQNVKPGLLSLVLVPVNMDNVHWGLMVLDVKNKEAYFDDGLGYSFSKTSYVFLIMSELELPSSLAINPIISASDTIRVYIRLTHVQNVLQTSAILKTVSCIFIPK